MDKIKLIKLYLKILCISLKTKASTTHKTKNKIYLYAKILKISKVNKQTLLTKVFSFR